MNTFWPGRELIVQWYPFDEDKSHPSVSWLKMVWKNLYIHFSEDLALFDEMPLVPRTALEAGQACVELIRLRVPSSVILEDESEVQLPEFVADVVQKLGGTQSQSAFYYHHASAILNSVSDKIFLSSWGKPLPHPPPWMPTLGQDVEPH